MQIGLRYQGNPSLVPDVLETLFVCVPHRQYLDQEVALSDDTVHKYSDVVLEKLNKTIEELRRLFLVEDLVDSIKFAVLMWILTYVGALFNGLTLLILGLIGAFSCPIIYEKHQVGSKYYPQCTDLVRTWKFVQLAAAESSGLLLTSVCPSCCNILSLCVSGSDRSLPGAGQQPDQGRGGKVSQQKQTC
ncbi:hypothetical protein XENORESO_001724 [Xenotaenia resolanae]|uniref:Reticulon n=1 Tax=Xenotaenia resolanae TaxID=208358 RepID=A0ABV0X0H0_9TELE